jgi:HAD superfamily hydrolase (TIGR01484 family)
MSKPAIFVDIDGCLIPTDGNVSREYFESLAWLANYIGEANIGRKPNIKICTGRSVAFTDAIFHLIGRPYSAGSIAENGCVFFNPLTRETKINPAISKDILAVLAKIRSKIVPKLIKSHPGLWIYPGNEVNIILERKIDSESQAINLATVKKAARRLVARLRAVRVISLANSISIVPERINKGTAVMFLAEKEDIDLKHSLGIGDAKSDLSFLREVGFVGCPSNASEDCKELVKAKKGCISFFSCAKGVVDVIEHFSP